MKLTKKSKVLRIIAAMLSLVLLFSFAACNKDDKNEIQQDEIVEPEKKVAILVAPESQYPEDYNAAMELAEKYPDSVIVKEFEDSRILHAGDSEIITISTELAADPEIGAIVYARAVQFTQTAISRAKSLNPDLVTICIEPEESIDDIVNIANLVYCVDWAKAAEDIAAEAKEQGAEYFVLFSPARHNSKNALIRGGNEAIKAACEAQGITYVHNTSFDTNNAEQIAGAQKYINEAVARLYLNEEISGTNVVLFSTDSAVQTTLIEQVNERGLIYICPSFPTAYSGVGEVYEIAKPESISDVSTYIESAKAAAEADAEGKARISMYANPLASALVEGAVHSAFDILNGTITADNMTEKAATRVIAAAGTTDCTAEAYSSYKNAVMAYQPGFEVIK